MLFFPPMSMQLSSRACRDYEAAAWQGCIHSAWINDYHDTQLDLVPKHEIPSYARIQLSAVPMPHIKRPCRCVWVNSSTNASSSPSIFFSFPWRLVQLRFWRLGPSDRCIHWNCCRHHCFHNFGCDHQSLYGQKSSPVQVSSKPVSSRNCGIGIWKSNEAVSDEPKFTNASSNGRSGLSAADGSSSYL